MTQRFTINDVDFRLKRYGCDKGITYYVCNDCTVSVSANYEPSLDEIKAFVIGHMSEITAKISKIRARCPWMFCWVTGDTIWHLGQKYTLRLVHDSGKKGVCINGDFIDLHVPEGTVRAARGKVLNDWRRQLLTPILDEMIKKWCPIMEETKPIKWDINGRFTSTLGLCNKARRKISFSLQLIMYPVQSIETVVVHELTHLKHDNHLKIFYDTMTHYLPDWRKWDNLMRKQMEG